MALTINCWWKSCSIKACGPCNTHNISCARLLILCVGFKFVLIKKGGKPFDCHDITSKRPIKVRNQKFISLFVWFFALAIAHDVFVATKHIFCRDKTACCEKKVLKLFCRDKTTTVLSHQVYFRHDKKTCFVATNMFVVTKMILVAASANDSFPEVTLQPPP